MKIRILLFLTLLVATASVATADPLTFSNVKAFQNSGNTSINLFGNTPTLTGTQISFLIDVTGTLAPGSTDTLRVTYQDSLGGNVVQDIGIPVFGVVNPPVTVLVTINVPTFSFVAIPAMLTVDLLNSNPDFIIPTTQTGVNSYTYSFNVVQPVPEPATLMTLSSGLGALMFKYQKNRKNKKSREL